MRLLLLLLLTSLVLGKEILFYHDDSSSWKKSGGTVDISNESLTLKGDASVDLKDFGFSRPPSATLSFYVKHHKHAMSPMEMVGAPSHLCHCAQKVRMGMVELEVGENWIRVQLLNKDLTLDTVLVDTVNPHYAPGKEQFVQFYYDEMSATVSIDGSPVVALPVTGINVHDITLSSYMGTFTVSSFAIETEYDQSMVINKAEQYIEIPAQFKPNQFNSLLHLKNHHFITWEKGRAGGGAMFTTPIPDSTVHKALDQIGAIPGNNLTQESWTKRKDHSHSDPDIHAEGTELEITFYSNGRRYSVEEILVDEKGGNHHFVFAGNLAFIPVWKSGCVVCLQSCPGSKISNATYTMRDLAQKKVGFRYNKELFEAGEQVWIRFQLKGQNK